MRCNIQVQTARLAEAEQVLLLCLLFFQLLLESGNWAVRLAARQDRSASCICLVKHWGAACACTVQGGRARLAKAEQALEVLLDARLGAGPSGAGQGSCDDDAMSNDSWPSGLQDDYLDSDAEAAADSDDSNGDDSSSLAASRAPSHGQEGSNKAQQNTQKGRAGGVNSPKEWHWEEVVDDSNPDSFSQVDLSRPPTEIQTQFPLFPVGFADSLCLSLMRHVSYTDVFRCVWLPCCASCLRCDYLANLFCGVSCTDLLSEHSELYFNMLQPNAMSVVVPATPLMLRHSMHYAGSCL